MVSRTWHDVDPDFPSGFPCSLQSMQIRVWSGILYHAFGSCSLPSPVRLLLSLLLPLIWRHFPSLTCVSLLSSFLQPLLHLCLGSLISQFPSQLFRLHTSPHCVQIHWHLSPTANLTPSSHWTLPSLHSTHLPTAASHCGLSLLHPLAESLRKGAAWPPCLSAIHRWTETFQACHFTQSEVLNRADTAWKSLTSNLELPLQSMELLLGKTSVAISIIHINHQLFSKLIPKNNCILLAENLHCYIQANIIWPYVCISHKLKNIRAKT